ncbi:arogenate dehydratase/prephenate dehydratase 1, chloroplastic-like [Salvia miltiorrhiza]|uniref:arogenate dehydratase/prephenate dehydratase 1, chloroplastic-like n=1 Tax=Salvia miltiorrhiza TaxID=226208 RepID=UPI0025AD08CF|nr:arogenate dehydratase/prephenate dehydratase 1, chloroplastic-like [Salvia miltiorrhiza]
MMLSQSASTKIPVLSQIYSPKLTNFISATIMPRHHDLQNHHIISKLRIAYQGVPGAYGEAAALKAYPNCETLQCQHFQDAIQAVERGWAEEAVIPIENSIVGSVHTNYDLLLRHTLHVVGETHLFVDHCLLALPAAAKHHLTSVFSHPQALLQCQMSLNMLGVAAIPTHNTGVAAQIVASRGVQENGAIASARAAQLYGLNILDHKFQDRSNNITRFLKLAREPLLPATNTRSKTSISFIPDELHKALSVFAQTGIHISKIESRPLQKLPPNAVNGFKHGSNMNFKYVYFIDFEASVIEPRAQYALERLQKLAIYVRVLGCYPMSAATW